MYDQTEQLTAMAEKIALLDRQVRGQRGMLVAIALIGAGLTIAAAAPATKDVIEAHAIRIVDQSGKPRILIGAPTPNDGRTRKDAQTASIVVLGPDGTDRLIFGEEPNPVVKGKTYPRIADGYGLLIHNKEGAERGGISYLDNGRGVISLDRPGSDAVEMVTNEVTGFAGLAVNYAAQQGQYEEGVRLGTKGDTAWLSLEDRSNNERARLALSGNGAPKLITRPASAKSSSAR